MSSLEPLPTPRRVDRSKVEDYLLHPVKGRGKAGFFGSCGFMHAKWQTLHDALLRHADQNPVVHVASSAYGMRYTVRGPLRTPDGRQPPPLACTVWQADNDSVGVRLITAYPG